MWCLRCGTREPGPDSNCKCGNELGPQEARIGYFNQMMRLTGELLAGKLSLDDYEKSIQWAAEAMDDMSKGLEPLEEQMKNMGFDEAAMAIMNRPMKAFREGIETFHEGIEKLRYYVYEQNQGYLQSGLTLMEKANNLFNYTSDTANYLIGDIAKVMTDEDKAEVDRQLAEKTAKN